MRSNLAAFPSSEPAPSWRPAEPAPEPDGTPPPRALAALLARADVRFNGGRPWDIQVHRPRLYGRMLAQWSLGAGEAYMDGDWDCERLDELFTRVMRADLDRAALGRRSIAYDGVADRCRILDGDLRTAAESLVVALALVLAQAVRMPARWTT